MINLHPKQAELIPCAQANPEDSYFLAGDFGTGKSLLLWTLYRSAVERHCPRVIVFTLTELLTEYRVFIQTAITGGTPRPPRLTAEDLRQNHTKFSIFINDIDKAKPTEYAAEQLFEIVDAVYEYKHQLVVTTNLGPSRLRDNFDRTDERFGGAIVRRLVDGARIFQMFKGVDHD